MSSGLENTKSSQTNRESNLTPDNSSSGSFTESYSFLSDAEPPSASDNRLNSENSTQSGS